MLEKGNSETVFELRMFLGTQNGWLPCCARNSTVHVSGRLREETLYELGGGGNDTTQSRKKSRQLSLLPSWQLGNIISAHITLCSRVAYICLELRHF